MRKASREAITETEGIKGAIIAVGVVVVDKIMKSKPKLSAKTMKSLLSS
jgi:hypothetical protein